MSSVHRQEHLISGLKVWTFSHSSASNSTKPVQIYFVLHPRLQSQESYEPRVRRILELIYETENLQFDVVLVSFDLRNHGERLVDVRANQGWKQGNPTHAIDMYNIMQGSVGDVSLLVDYLPSYLYPSGERHIAQWGVTGISLGGHIVWLLIAYEPRISLGVTIIGCPSYQSLMTKRAQQSTVPISPPYFPESFLRLLDQTSAEAVSYTRQDTKNPFWNKKLLILAGGKDTLVPWAESEDYVRNLQVGPEGAKVVSVYADAAHVFTTEMLEETAQFIGSSAAMTLSGRIDQRTVA